MKLSQSRFIEEMTRQWDMDWVRIGQMVEVSGDIGTIKNLNAVGNLDVVFANQSKFGTHAHNCHPTSDIKYFDVDGTVTHDYTSGILDS